MTILRTQAGIAEASMADLVETYNALAGKAIKKFETRPIAERRVAAAIMAAQDADAHTGVPKGASGEAKDRAEIVAKAQAKGLPVPPAPDAEDEAPFPPGSLAESLSKAAKAAKPIAARAKKEKPAASSAPSRAYAVQATGAGITKLQPAAIRTGILNWIAAKPKKLATIAALDAHFQCNTRGHLAKLAERNHVRLLTEAEHAKLVA